MAISRPEPAQISAPAVRRWMIRGFVAGLVLGLATAMVVLLS